MAVNNVDPNAKESKTVTTPYGGGAKVKATNVNSPSVHELAVDQARTEFGGHDNPNFEARVKDLEAQMYASLESTKDA